MPSPPRMSLQQARVALSDPISPLPDLGTRLSDTIDRCLALHDVWIEFAMRTGQPLPQRALAEHILFFVEQWGNLVGTWPQLPPTQADLEVWALSMSGCDRRHTLAKE